MLANQIASPNSPQWFNTGLAHAYGITGTAQGFWYVDPKTGVMTELEDSYTHPAPHACFPAGTLITTRGGLKPIEKIEPGDEVLTHMARWRPVLETMQRQVDEELVEFSFGKGRRFVATQNHPVRAMVRGADPRDPVGSVPAGSLTTNHIIGRMVDVDSPIDGVFSSRPRHITRQVSLPAMAVGGPPIAGNEPGEELGRRYKRVRPILREPKCSGW